MFLNMRDEKIVFTLFDVALSALADAQICTPKVSKHSVGVLANRIEVLKTSIKLLELKIDEAKEETEVEKLRLKLLEGNGNAKALAAQSSNNIEKTVKLIYRYKLKELKVRVFLFFVFL